MFENILLNIISSIIFVLLGFLINRISTIYFVIKPTKRLWRIKNSKELLLCIATSTQIDTGEYYKPATGIGQVRAIGVVIESLSKAYSIKIRNILLSIDQVQNQIEKDIIIFGGPKNNSISKLLLEKIRHLNIVTQDESSIDWLLQHPKQSFSGISVKNIVTKDFGLAIRMKNPFDTRGQTYITLFSGCHTYGIIAVSQYFTKYLKNEYKGLKKSVDNIFLIVACDVIDGFPVGIKLVKKHEF